VVFCWILERFLVILLLKRTNGMPERTLFFFFAWLVHEKTWERNKIMKLSLERSV
jgi:hypothetical protein